MRLARLLRTRSRTTAAHRRDGELPRRRHAAETARRAVRPQRSSIRCATADDLLGPASVDAAVAGTRFDPASAMSSCRHPSRGLRLGLSILVELPHVVGQQIITGPVSGHASRTRSPSPASTRRRSERGRRARSSPLLQPRSSSPRLGCDSLRRGKCRCIHSALDCSPACDCPIAPEGQPRPAAQPALAAVRDGPALGFRATGRPVQPAPPSYRQDRIAPPLYIYASPWAVQIHATPRCCT